MEVYLHLQRAKHSFDKIYLRFHSNALPLRVLPLVKEGEFLFSFHFSFSVCPRVLLGHLLYAAVQAQYNQVQI